MRQLRGDLPDTEIPPDPPALPLKRRWMRWLLLVPLLVFLGALWLNGPGLRYLAPRIVDRYMKQAGLGGKFRVEGRLTDGLAFADLRIEGKGALESLTVDRLIPSYNMRGLFRGELEGLTLEGVHADLRLGQADEDEQESPLDLERISRTLRGVRAQMLPLDLEVKDITVHATQDGKPALSLAKSRIAHVANSEDFTLELGKLSNGDGREWAAQDTKINWQPENLSISNMVPFPGIGLRDFLLQMPVGGQMSLESMVDIEGAVFMLTTSPGLGSAKLDLLEGQLKLAETAAAFGHQMPVSATLSSLAVELDEILPDPKAASGTARVLLENVAWEDWTARELSLDATLASSRATLAARGIALGTEISLEATAPVTRGEAGFSLGEAQGRLSVADLPRMLRELSFRVPAINGEAILPAAKLDGNFTVGFGDNTVELVQAKAAVQAADPKLVSDLTIEGRWTPGEPISAEITLDGLTASGTYQLEPRTYQGAAEFSGFSSTRIERWLDAAGVDLGGVVDLTGEWSGSGELDEGIHRGDLSLEQGTWTREEMPAITAIGGVKYDWPGSFETRGLRVRMDEQSLVLDAELANNLLDVRDFVWSSGEQELATGTASLPLPQDFAKWRETLAQDDRPISLFLNSRELSLGLLSQWIPALDRLDPNSTGQLRINITGTYPDPVVEAKIDARNLRSPAQPELPPTDLSLGLVGRDGRLTIQGSATAPDLPAAEMNATLAFRPAAWAEEPELLKNEPIDGRIQLPRLEISRFTTLVPVAEQLTGVVTGNVVIAGTLGEPDLRGALDLAGAGIRFRDVRIPALEGMAGTLDLARDRIVLRNLRSNVAGGTLAGEGSVIITEGALGEIDVRLRGDHVPVIRNDQFIIRANADLRLQGTVAQATLSGTIGTVDSLFYRDIEILPMGTPFTTPEAAELPRIDTRRELGTQVPEAFRDWALNVTVRTLEPLLLRGNVANGDITGLVRIGGTFGNPAPDGQIRVRDFRATLPFSTLNVRSGTATFTPETGFDPILELRGTAEPRPYRVNIFVYGRASDPQHILTSNPPLPENEIMTLLATGTTTEGLEDPQAAASRALQLLIEELRRGRFRFGRQLRPLLRLLDRVDFTLAEADPFTTEAYSTATLSVTDRWFLSAGVGETGDSRFLAIWRYSFR
jgi:hypothetical protein